MESRHFELIEPKDVIKFYINLYNGERKNITTRLFKGESEINIESLLPKDYYAFKNHDEDIIGYLQNNNVELFMKEINKVYHTRVKLEKIDFQNVFPTIDSIKEMDVNKFIEKLHGITSHYEYSFATKVFNFIEPNVCPVLDSVSVSLLKRYFEQSKLARSGWGNYDNYKEDYMQFCEEFGLNNYTLKEVDVFLWTYGKVIEKYWTEIGVIRFDNQSYSLKK